MLKTHFGKEREASNGDSNTVEPQQNRERKNESAKTESKDDG